MRKKDGCGLDVPGGCGSHSESRVRGYDTNRVKVQKNERLMSLNTMIIYSPSCISGNESESQVTEVS